MDKFSCNLCEKIESFVHICEEKHFVCERCVDVMTQDDLPHLCSCGGLLLARQSNPLDALIEETCPHRDCNWAFNNAQMAEHVAECRYRPYKCIGNTLKIWNCQWTGRQIELPEHLATEHPELGPILPHNAKNRIPFDDTQSMGTLNLVNAFSRHFVFFYYTDVGTGLVYFMVFLLGRRSTASRYYAEFQLNYASTLHERVSFVTPCVSDCSDIPAMLVAEECIVLTHSSVRKYIGADGCLGFRLFVKDKKAQPVPSALAADDSEGVTTKSAPKPKPLVAAKPAVKKAPLPNNQKKAATSASSGASNTSVGPLNSRVPATQSQPGRRSSVFSSESHTAVSAAQKTFSVTPASNSSNSKYSQIYRQQPYKAVDEKFYTLKYPSSSIQKPVYKK